MAIWHSTSSPDLCFVSGEAECRFARDREVEGVHAPESFELCGDRRGALPGRDTSTIVP